MTAFAMGVQEGVQDCRRSSQKPLSCKKNVFVKVRASGLRACKTLAGKQAIAALSSRLLRIRARGPQRTTGLSFCAALRCDSIKNAAALQ